jgi:hypothetical protein
MLSKLKRLLQQCRSPQRRRDHRGNAERRGAERRKELRRYESFYPHILFRSILSIPLSLLFSSLRCLCGLCASAVNGHCLQAQKSTSCAGQPHGGHL